MPDYADFRQRLEAVLRTLDVKQVTGFLIAESQWGPERGMPDDPEFAMWMMIAGNPSLQDLHERARAWLLSHGHQEEANLLLAGRGKGKKKPSMAFLEQQKGRGKKARGGQSKKKPYQRLHLKRKS